MTQRHLAAALAITLALGACDDMLVEEPKAFITTNTYYRTPEEIESGVLAGYNAIRNALNIQHNSWWAAPGRASDQEAGHPTEITNLANMTYMTWTDETPSGTESGWNNLFQAIYRVNIVLDRIEEIEMSAARRTELTAEAKFIRAYSYMWLDRGYSSGTKLTDLSVPLFRSEADHANPDLLVRAPIAEVHAQIIQDLAEAEAGLPLSRPSGQSGRATKGAARMALADIYLWRSSFHLQNDWNKASAAAKRVIDSNQHSLVRTGFFNIWNATAESANRERIFWLEATGIQGRSTTQYVNLHGPRDLGFGTGGGFGTNPATWWHVKSYAPGDVRGTVGGTTRPGMFEADTFAYRNYACSTGTRFTGSSPGPNGGFCGTLPFNTVYPYKFRPRQLNAGQGDVDIILYRLAEALLMYAEAENELGNTPTAIQYVNMVRARARLGATGTQSRTEPADLPLGLSKEQARDAIYMERNWELAHEGGKRWWDQVRRDSMEPGYWGTTMSEHDPMAVTRLPDLAQRTYLKRFPIPATEVNLAPQIVQNPGY